MLSIKLSRIGKKKQPVYRVIVLDKRKDPWGDYLENLGFYNPRTKPKTIELKEERIKYWISVGAQPSPTIHNLLVDAKIIKGSKVKATIQKKKTIEKKPAEAPVKASDATPTEQPKTPEKKPIEEKTPETKTESQPKTEEKPKEEKPKEEKPKEEKPKEEKPKEEKSQ